MRRTVTLREPVDSSGLNLVGNVRDNESIDSMNEKSEAHRRIHGWHRYLTPPRTCSLFVIDQLSACLRDRRGSLPRSGHIDADVFPMTTQRKFTSPLLHIGEGVCVCVCV